MPYFYIRSRCVGRFIGESTLENSSCFCCFTLSSNANEATYKDGRNINSLRDSHNIEILAPRHLRENIEKLAGDPCNWTSIWSEEVTDELIRDLEDIVGFRNVRYDLFTLLMVNKY